MNLMFQPFVKYVDFQGRARRTEYWLWFLFQIIASIIFSVLHNVIDHGSQTGPAKIVESLFNLAILLPSLAVAVRRFHDIGRTGWWLLFPLLVLIIALIVYLSINNAQFMSDMKNISGMAGQAGTPDGAMAIMKAFAPMALWVGLPYFLASIVTFVFHVTDGTAGNNRFGPDPKGRGSSAAKVF